MGVARGAAGGSRRANGGCWVVRWFNNEGGIRVYKAVSEVGVRYISRTSVLAVTRRALNRPGLERLVWTTTISNSFLTQHLKSLRQIEILECKARTQQFAHVHEDTPENERCQFGPKYKLDRQGGDREHRGPSK